MSREPDATPRRLSPAMVAVAATITALVVLLHVVRLPEPLGVDQGLFACFTRWVPRGWLPYRDLFDSKPPLFLYWYALAAAVPGDVIRAIWWVEGAWLAATLTLAYALGARVWGRWEGLAAAALLAAGLWSPAWGGFWSRAQAEELLAMPMLAAAWAAWGSRSRPSLAFVAGALTGVCGLFKIPSMAIAGAWAVAWVVTDGLGTTTKRLALLAGGVATPWALAAGWFAAHGALGAFVEGVFVYHRHNAAFITPPWGYVVEQFAWHLVAGAPLPVAAAAIGTAMLFWNDAREARWVAPWIALTLAAIVLQRQLASYHYLLAMPALAIAGGYGVVATARAIGSSTFQVRALGATGALAVAALAVVTLVAFARGYRLDYEVTTGRIARTEYLRRIQLGNYSNASEEEAALYVRERSEARDGLLVWGLSPGMYAIADRHPVTRFPFHKLLMTDAPLSRMIPGLEARKAQLMARMIADPPAYVLVGRDDRNGFESLDSAASLQRFVELRDLVDRDYAREKEIGHFTVYRRTAR